MKVKIAFFFCLLLVFLPFTQALTINVGFPLKVSELLLLLLLFLYLFKGRIPKTYIILFNKNKILLLFLFWVILSFSINILWSYNYALKDVPYRINAKADSLLRLFYVVLCVSAFFLSLFFLISESTKVLKYWVRGAVIAACYSWYLFIFSALDFPYIKLFGMESEPQSLFGIIRSGTFKEGNFFGLFLILSASVSFYKKSNKAGWFLLLSIVTTMSTISIVSACVFLIYLYRKKLFRGKMLFIYPVILILFLSLSKTEFFKEYVEKKMFQPVSHLTTANFSKVDRYLTGRIAFKQGIDNPVFGVGPYNYGLHYDRYNDYRNVVLNPSEYFDIFIARKNIRAITNNVYLEVWAEYGIIGFLIFILFLIQILMISLKNKNDSITGGVIAILISFNAFPSFIMLFIWVFFAIPVAISYRNKIAYVND